MDTSGGFLLRDGEFTPLPIPPNASAEPGGAAHIGLNDRGEISGGYTDPAGNTHGFLWRRGRFTTIDVLGAMLTTGHGLNDRHQVVGQYVDAGATPNGQGVFPAGTVHGYLWDDGEVTTIDVPGAALTQPLGINDRGQIVGAYCEVAPGGDPYASCTTGRLRGFLLTRGRFTTIDFPGGDGTKVSGINDRGQMVGYYDTEGTRRGYLLDRGRFTRIDPPGSLLTLPSGIDNRGRVVGGYLDPNGVNGRGFLRDRRGRLTIIDAPGDRTDTVAIDINDRGHILIPPDGSVYRGPEASPSERSPAALAGLAVTPAGG